ncbi:MAG: type II toxin-antitoxin system VapC family toxin [Deltaproteobacteria bacterium]|nr:type II toxin-antitoxin system VapC family toxin [Deltaproteobacteria bacterium]
MIVADTNVVSYLLIDGEHTGDARRVWERDPAWALPSLWRSEYLNVLATSVRAEVLTGAQALAAWHAGIRLFGRAEQEPDGEAVLAAALALGISAYDAHFVVVANDLKVPLVTGDRALQRACSSTAVLMADFGRR